MRLLRKRRSQRQVCSAEKTLKNMFDLSKILPQSYPFVMIDRIVEFEKGKSLTAIKNISANEWWMEGKAAQGTGHKAHEKASQVTGHKSQETANAIFFPETLLIEAAAQTALAFGKLSGEATSERLYFIGKTEAEFFARCQIGDQVVLKVCAHKLMAKQGLVEVEEFVEGKLIGKVKVFYSVR